MRKIFLSFVFVCSLPVLTAHSAESNMRPGLWEMTTTSDILKLVPQIPPDQMQNLMNLAKQNGFDMPQIQNGAATSKVCITQQMADQKIPPDFYQNQSGCSAKNATHIGNKYRLEFVCENANLKGNGTAEGVFTSSERFSGRTEFDGVAQGNPIREHADTSGRWVSANCKTVNSTQ
ncbi:MAG: DUF3617 domain-containing protein [Glaciimonas sp.]|nr:DUF3617 domain-containing protein [Glaciimonas sp.]